MILGAQIDNCFSFADCATLLVHGIRDILAASPADLVGSLPSTFEQASQEFLEIASSNNLTIVEAYNRSIAMAQLQDYKILVIGVQLHQGSQNNHNYLDCSLLASITLYLVLLLETLHQHTHGGRMVNLFKVLLRTY